MSDIDGEVVFLLQCDFGLMYTLKRGAEDVIYEVRLCERCLLERERVGGVLYFETSLLSILA